MDRRHFLETCSAHAACAPTGLSASACSSAARGIASLASLASLSTHALAADALPKNYGRVLLTDERGDPLKARSLKPQVNYIFHYPFEATPVFLLDLGKAVPALKKDTLRTEAGDAYAWPGGVGKARSLVAFSAICAHQLVYPTQQLSFISFRKGKPVQAKTPDAGADLIHCCADHSQYDPAQGAKVMSGPAKQPLCAVLLDHNAKDDTLTAYATLGGELFDAFFKKYEAKLSIEVGSKARQAVAQRSVVKELERYCKNPVKC
ncbi:MAG: (2Fe-2S)-binding protein [Leptolyngbyaceae cyanobacterium CSU_1_3]|nr:(2Fe-2S)-binding protein [Leptolyngbyaceae cyanobacterium CSU_1_3]